jgi:hypothetical protein
MAQRQVLLCVRSVLLSAGGLSGRMLPFHYHRHCTHVSLMAMFGMNVFQHCLSGQRAWVSDASVELYALYVGAGTTDKGRTSLVSTDAVHN